MKLKAILITAVVGIVVCLLGAAASAQAAPFVYVTNELSNDVSQYDIGAGGLLAPLSPPTVAAGTAPQEGVAVSPDGKSVYVSDFSANFASGQISQYDVGPDGGLTPKSPPTVAAGDSPRGVAVSPDGQSVYVANFSSPGSVFQYDVGAGGELLPKSPPTVATPGFSAGVAVSPDGKSVYVVNFRVFVGGDGGSTISQFDVGAGGELLPKSPPTVPSSGSGPVGIAVSPDGRSVYVANFAVFSTGPSGTVSQYDVDPDGALTPKSPATVEGPGEPRYVAVNPDGKSVYVTATGLDSVLQYDVGAGGALQAKSPFLVPAGEIPDGVAVSPDGRSVYVTNVLSNDVSQYDVGTDGGLTPKSPASVAAGGFPNAVAVSPPPRVPTSKEQCKNGGWRDFPQFRNQGQCIAFVNHGP
jgi:DNA-binding beta-propeller fold protein YncE